LGLTSGLYRKFVMFLSSKNELLCTAFAYKSAPANDLIEASISLFIISNVEVAKILNDKASVSMIEVF